MNKKSLHKLSEPLKEKNCTHLDKNRPVGGYHYTTPGIDLFLCVQCARKLHLDVLRQIIIEMDSKLRPLKIMRKF